MSQTTLFEDSKETELAIIAVHTGRQTTTELMKRYAKAYPQMIAFQGTTFSRHIQPSVAIHRRSSRDQPKARYGAQDRSALPGNATQHCFGNGFQVQHIQSYVMARQEVGFDGESGTGFQNHSLAALVGAHGWILYFGDACIGVRRGDL